MEYKLIYLPMSANEASELLTELSKYGWRVVALTDNKVILGRETK